ncbi:MAG: hypothetical protein PWQ60_321 [Thermoanaerobacteraceae bacterium]|nr:hypothetical protein [Thermoanaerobacteraceae bacterium]
MYNVLFFNYFENNSQKFVIGYARKGLMLLTNLDIKDGKDCLRPILCYIEYDGLGREFYCHFTDIPLSMPLLPLPLKLPWVSASLRVL